MIDFKDNEMRDTAVVYNSIFEQIKDVYEDDPVFAGELAISAIELALTGEISSDDKMIKIMLKPFQKINEKNHEKYDNKKERAKIKQIEDLKLDQIAEFINRGCSQRETGEKLGLSQQVVSYRMSIIREKYPGLLQKDFVQKTKNTKTTNFVQVCTNQSEFVQKENFVSQKVFEF